MVLCIYERFISVNDADFKIESTLKFKTNNSDIAKSLIDRFNRLGQVDNPLHNIKWKFSIVSIEDDFEDNKYIPYYK